ncbi:hypothetical protein A2U01_0085803, partial [Trifolium medium]|nr:hypothetical protein [Trifolium medium]
MARCAVHSDSNINSLCQLRGAPSSMARCAVKIMKHNCLLEVARRTGRVTRRAVEKFKRRYVTATCALRR